MRNFLKIISLFLVLAISVTLFAGAVFVDKDDVGTDYKDDVTMLVELGVIAGYPDGSFKPEGNITRAQFCKMAYVLKYGSDDKGLLFSNNKSTFWDVEGNASIAWAKGYINYCASNGIISGVGAGRFNPNGNITVAEASKILLVILGCDAKKEGFSGSNWQANVVGRSMELKVFDGWVGDATTPLTRQLAAKLMRNTLFAPIFVYSPITGLGSQFNAVTNEENQTLAENTMKLKHIQGVLVANENYALPLIDQDTLEDDVYPYVDENGNPIASRLTRDDVDHINPQVQPIGKSQVYYEYLSNGTEMLHKLITIPATTADEMIGSLVDVYCTGEGDSKNGTITNVKVVGNVLVNSKTVTFDAFTGDIKFKPNKDNSAKDSVKPYISFFFDGKEYKMDAPAKQGRVKGNVNYVSYAPLFFENLYYTESTASTLNRGVMRTVNSIDNPMIASIDTSTLGTYKFISTDGGSTFDYAILLNRYAVAEVGNYDAKSGRLSASGLGAKQAEDLILDTKDLANGDRIVYTVLNGKINVFKAEKVTGTFSTISSNDVITVDGKTLRADANILNQRVGASTFKEYFTNNPNSNNEDTDYYVYKGLFVVDIVTGSGGVGAIGDYAVCTTSYSLGVGDMADAYVKLTFTDGTSDLYRVSKFYEREQPKQTASDFASNKMFGALFRAKKDGVDGIDLSFDKPIMPSYATGTDAMVEGNIYYCGGKSMMSNPNSTLFLLSGDLSSTTYPKPVTATAYKLDDLSDVGIGAIPIGTSQTIPLWPTNPNDVSFASYKLASDQGPPELLVGVMTVNLTTSKIVTTTNKNGYLLSAIKQYNIATGAWRTTVKMITKDGVVEMDTIDGLAVDGISYSPPMPGKKAAPQYIEGSIVKYQVNNKGKITGLEVVRRETANGGFVQNWNKTDLSGWYVMNILASNSDVISYIDWSETSIAAGDVSYARASSVKMHQDAVIVSVDGKAYAGDAINFADTGVAIPASKIVLPGESSEVYNNYNAIVRIEDGKVAIVYSLMK